MTCEYPREPRRKAWLPSLCLIAALSGPLTGCLALGSRLDTAQGIAAQAGFQPMRQQAGRFLLSGWIRKAPAGSSETLAVYIEGDGFAFISPSEVSSDPTPIDPVGLRLAARHPGSGPVLYLARPCQYLSGAAINNCSSIYWTTHRYAPEVIDSIGLAIDREKARLGAGKLDLIGFSGGGVVAALLAARRDDVARLTTLGANLDVAAWTRGEELTPLAGSLDPVDETSRLASIPQQHFVGAKDDVVPPYVLKSYMRKLGHAPLARLTVMPDADHDCCWLDRWPGLLNQ